MKTPKLTKACAARLVKGIKRVQPLGKEFEVLAQWPEKDYKALLKAAGLKGIE
jgi:hypothetical protein